MAACYLNYTMKQGNTPTRTIFYLSDFSSVAWHMEANPSCVLCGKKE